MAKKRWDGVPPTARSEATRKAALARWARKRTSVSRQAQALFKFLADGGSAADYKNALGDLPLSKAIEIIELTKLALATGQDLSDLEQGFERPEDADTAKFVIPDY